jgi:hypothetical protein
MTNNIAIAQAAGKALGIWFLVYVLVVHLYVVWKWDGAVMTISHGPQKDESQNVTTIRPWFESEEFLDRMRRLEKVIETLQEKITETIGMQQQVQELTLLVLERQQQDNRNTAAPPVGIFASEQQQQRQMHNPTQLKALVENRQQLGHHYPSVSTLRLAFRYATHDLRRNIQSAATVDWLALNQAMQEIVKELLGQSTTTTTGCNENIEQGNSTMTMADLDNHIQQVRQRLSDRRAIATNKTSLPFFFPDTMERLQMVRDQRISAAKNPDYSNGDQQQCVQAHDVLPWLDAGLDAMYRQQDVRHALVQAVPGVPLAAMNAVAALPRPGRTSHRNLRQWLDQPLADTLHIAQWLNAIVDAFSGYYEPLDQFVDSLELSDVGRTAVEQILRAAGRVKLPLLH